MPSSRFQAGCDHWERLEFSQRASAMSRHCPARRRHHLVKSSIMLAGVVREREILTQIACVLCCCPPLNRKGSLVISKLAARVLPCLWVVLMQSAMHELSKIIIKCGFESLVTGHYLSQLRTEVSAPCWFGSLTLPVQQFSHLVKHCNATGCSLDKAAAHRQGWIQFGKACPVYC